ncbi:MAG: YybH family protein [Hyphomonas sp.]
MVRILFAISALMLLPACAQSVKGPAPISSGQTAKQSEVGQIEALLIAQDKAWNVGDIDAFMDGYWDSPELRFASGGTVTRGWDETNRRYHARYNTPEKMGRLTTSDYEIALMAPDVAVAHGRWRLDVANDAPSGLYTLILRKIDGQWKITSDTTTSAN